MAIITSDDITIEIGGTDYSVYIDEYSEEGGARQYQIIKTYGNNYKRVETGRTNFSIEFHFRMDEQDLNALFEATSPLTIVITDATNTQQTITYNNMLPEDLTPEAKVDDLLSARLKYSAPAYTGGSVNRVIS